MLWIANDLNIYFYKIKCLLNLSKDEIEEENDTAALWTTKLNSFWTTEMVEEQQNLPSKKV